MANKHMRRYTISLVMWEIQIQTMNYHDTKIKMAIGKRQTIPSVGEYVEPLKASSTVDENVKCYNPFGKQIFSLLKG